MYERRSRTTMSEATVRRPRVVTVYRDDSTVQVRYERVKTFFWTAGNSVLVIAQYDADEGDQHHYVHWPRERFCWFRDESPHVER